MADPVYRKTGVKAAIDGLECLQHWETGPRGLDTVAACSASDGAVFRGEGNQDWHGVAVGYGLPVKMPGDKFTFTGSDRSGQGWQSASDGTIVTRAKIICPIKTGRYLFYHLFFAANGSLTSGAYSATDTGTPNPPSAKGLTFKIDDAVVRGVDYWEFEIVGNETDPSWPSHMEGWPVRDAGNIDATFTWHQTFDEMSQLPAVNSFYEFKPYTNATQYYDIKWGEVLSKPVTYPVEGRPPGKADYIRAVCKAHFSGYHDNTQGHIKKPGDVAYWPAE